MTDIAIDRWEIRDFDPGMGNAEGDGWLAIELPGDTYLALHNAGRLPHPHAAENEAACAWVKDREWWWRTRFAASPAGHDERVELVFEGLDTFATIWLNGEEIAATDNMFREYRFDVGSRLRAGDNEIAIRFTPTALVVADRQVDAWPIISDAIQTTKRTLIRKAQFGWGWDWGPALPSVGIWKPVRLERHERAAIRDLRFETLAIGDTATVAIGVEVEAFAGDAVASVTLADPDGRIVATAELPGGGRVELPVPDAQLWWTPELGSPALYTLTATLDTGDSRTMRVGIRTIALDQSPDPDEPGTTFFRFILNGVPIFARGANWIPASNFVGAIPAGTYARDIGRAADANMNMIRVWGGGVYEQDVFYDLCDEKGLLVWQDFMFACAPYPEGPDDFVATIGAEIEHQVKRLRSRACLALWCGNNEGDAVQQFVNRMTGTDTPFSGDLYIHQMMPDAIARLDLATPYWPGSPGGGPSHNSMRGGDVHNWTVWHGLPPIPDTEPVGEIDRSPEGIAFTRYAEDQSRFVSEFGIQASPALSTLQRWMGDTTVTLDDLRFLNRIKDHPKDKVFAMLQSCTPDATDLPGYVRYTQALQAEGLKFGIEHYRRRKPHNSGTLIWQLNDCWPGISWSLFDSDGIAKPSWYAVRRVYAPVMASFRDDGDGVIELWMTNDTLKPVTVDAEVSLVTLDGETIWTRRIETEAPVNASAAIARFAVDAAPDRVLIVRSPDFAGNRHYFAALKDMPLAGTVDAAMTERDGALTVTLTAKGYCHGILLLADDPDTRFSDNAIDLADGERCVVTVTNAQRPVRADDIRIAPILTL